ncbi:putative spermidine/putrescine transport system substrate-binding protein [Mycoplana sp. BE70]|uniref:ABC transporter substrate-binding protein n=1 Tax=Mycoplana sp. BE70 TaxID=2817775 RepID=UPI0028561473|nr:ABC transporter substrate-binding protein [Mycoplana sp. BE70]MDR6756971.1 putative spermidine/putrescine transport system substrate-binding protein [Mycoplana sp. BE70]
MARRWKTTFLAAPASALVLLSSTSLVCAASTDELLAAARKEGQLTVMALPRDWCQYGRIIDGFKAKYGLAVEELSPEATSEEELDAIRAARDNGDPQAPDVIDIGLSFATSARSDGLLQPYKVSTWETIPDAAKNTEGYWYGDYYGLLAFEVNLDRVSRLPTDWADLASPEYKESVGLAGSLGSNHAVQSVIGAGLSATSGRIDGAAERGLEYFAELNRRGNFVPIVGSTKSVLDGRTPILIRWDYLALADREAHRDKARIEVVWPRTGLVAGIYVQAISAHARHPNAARLWMEYLYSDEGQLTLLGGHCNPIRFDSLVHDGKIPVSLQERLPDLGDEKGRIRPVFPTAKQQDRARETILNGWDGIVGVTIECTPPEEAEPVPMSLNEPSTLVCAAVQ